MKRDNRSADSSEMFDSLVRNALAFLERSVDELKDAPNYAVIDFCTAIELFLKARLLLEHWALVYEDPRRANQDKFREGDFKSVGMTEAIARLKDISGQRVAEKPKKIFEEIRQHRNRLVHFFHPAYGPKPDAAAVGNVTAELCRGWCHLYPLLSWTWKSHFASYASSLKRINEKMHQNRSFLMVKYEARSKSIERLKAKGIVVDTCFFCGFEAMRRSVIGGPVLLVDCLVCETNAQGLGIECPACGASPSGLIGGVCWKCSRPISLGEVLAAYAPIEGSRALCGNRNCLEVLQGSDCYNESVVLFDDKWVCLICFAQDEDTWNCTSCGRKVAGEFNGPLCFECELQEDDVWPPMFGGVMFGGTM